MGHHALQLEGDAVFPAKTGKGFFEGRDDKLVHPRLNPGKGAFGGDGLSEDMAKKAEQQVQDLTNQYVKKVDDILEAKEADIMTI